MNLRRRTGRAPLAAMSLAVAAVCGLAPLAMPATALGSPAARPAAASAIAGYVFSDNNNSQFDFYNSVQGNGVSVDNEATGQYTVGFFGMGSIAGKAVVQVSSAEEGTTCAIGGWIAVGKDLQITVDCYGVGHVPADRDFIVTYASANSIMGINGQVVANAFANGKAAVYQPAVQYDSTKGAKITVAHLSTGAYEVLAAGSSGNTAKFSGNPQINAVGSRGRHCDVPGWEQQLTPEIFVQCVDSAGRPVDSPFAIEWVVP